MSSARISYLAGLATLPVAVTGLALLNWAFSRNEGNGGCRVCTVLQPNDPGELLNITVRARRFSHRYITGRTQWHKDSWAVHPANPVNRQKRLKEWADAQVDD